MRWPWQKRQPAYQIGYAITYEECERPNAADRYDAWLAEMQRAYELEAAYMLSPELRPEPDPYIWHDPWEGKPTYD